jgi:hypothetical protein
MGRGRARLRAPADLTGLAIVAARTASRRSQELLSAIRAGRLGGATLGSYDDWY